MAEPTRKLRVLILDGREERLREVTTTVMSLGHEVIGSDTDLTTVHDVTVAGSPDVALVIVGENSGEGLEMIRTIVHEAACPVIAILDLQDRAFIDQAARLGIFAAIVRAGDRDEMQSSMDIALERFAEYHALEGAFGRRAITERAKGILMERHAVDEQRAFEMLRDHARRTNRKMVDVAESVLASHRLLAGGKEPEPSDDAALARAEERTASDKGPR
jgi:response regulator NasT